MNQGQNETINTFIILEGNFFVKQISLKIDLEMEDDDVFGVLILSVPSLKSDILGD
jgi:hypothetical protein